MIKVDLLPIQERNGNNVNDIKPHEDPKLKLIPCNYPLIFKRLLEKGEIFQKSYEKM